MLFNAVVTLHFAKLKWGLSFPFSKDPNLNIQPFYVTGPVFIHGGARYIPMGSMVRLVDQMLRGSYGSFWRKKDKGVCLLFIKVGEN